MIVCVELAEMLWAFDVAPDPARDVLLLVRTERAPNHKTHNARRSIERQEWHFLIRFGERL
jgi:hypothetical protein